MRRIRRLESVLKVMDRLLSFVTGCVLLLVTVFAAYMLWDSRQIYDGVRQTREQLRQMRPVQVETEKPDAEVGEEAQAADFHTLRAINPDVRAWLTLDGTAIDDPVLQGTSNLSYFSTDPFGEYSLAGSIFMDARLDPNGGWSYGVIYGHHMEKHAMFGDLDLYADAEFFNSRGRGSLIFPDGEYTLEPMAYLTTAATERLIFDPEYSAEHPDELLSLAATEATHINRTALERGRMLLRIDQTAVEDALKSPLTGNVEADRAGGILALATCTAGDRGDADSRTVVLFLMEKA